MQSDFFLAFVLALYVRVHVCGTARLCMPIYGSYSASTYRYIYIYIVFVRAHVHTCLRVRANVYGTERLWQPTKVTFGHCDISSFFYLTYFHAKLFFYYYLYVSVYVCKHVCVHVCSIAKLWQPTCGNCSMCVFSFFTHSCEVTYMHYDAWYVRQLLLSFHKL